MEQETLNRIPSEVQKFFKALSEDSTIREDFYGKFKSLVPKNWEGFVQLGKEKGYAFTIDDLKGILSDEFYADNRAAWRDTAEPSDDRDGMTSLISLEGTWIWTDRPERKISFTREGYSIYENDLETEKGKYKVAVEITIELTGIPAKNNEIRAPRARIGRFEDDTMTMVMEGKEKKYKRWLKGRKVNQPLKDSFLGAWLEIDAIDEGVQFIFTKDTLTHTVDKDKITLGMLFPNIPINYNLLSVGQILEFKNEKRTDSWTIKKEATDLITINQDTMAVTLKR